MKRVALAFVLCATALSASACGERAEPTGQTVPLYPVTVGGTSRPATTLDREPQRILALGPEMSRTLEALGVGDRVVQATRDEPGPPNADLVVGWASSPTGAGRSQREAPVYIASDTSIRAVERSLTDLGLLVGEPVAGRRLAEDIERRVQEADERLAGRQPVSAFVDRGFRATYSTQSLQGDMLRAAGARSVTGASLTQVDATNLLRLDPRFYLATSNSGVTLKSLRRNRTLRRLAAVRAGRFGTVPVRDLEPGPRIGAGVVAIARLLHPDAFR